MINLFRYNFFHISKKLYLSIIILFISISIVVQGQEVVYITGEVADINTKEPIPFSNIYLKNTQEGTTTDLAGKFKIEIKGDLPSDSLIISVIGYKKYSYYLNKNKKEHNVRIYLVPEIQSLDEVEIHAGENPANIIIRNAARNKNKYNKAKASAFEYRSYNHVELYITNINIIGNTKAIKDIKEWAIRNNMLNSLKNSDGNSLIPFYFVEAVSNYYSRKNPFAKKEIIISTKSKGIGINDDDGITKVMTGEGFSDYNFNNNQVVISDKYFPSPISDGWNVNYKFWLIDSMYVDDEFCYKLEVVPRNKGEIVFEGFIWITKEGFALKELDLALSESAQVNFIRSMKISQTLTRTEENIYMPSIRHLEIDIEGLIEELPGAYMKVYTYNDQFKINQPKPVKFFNVDISYDQSEIKEDESYWETFRKTRLSLGDSVDFEIYQLIDSVEKIPSVRRMAKLTRIIANGYIETKKIDYGPWIGFYSKNDIEGNRIGTGFKTSSQFSKRFLFKAYGAYGTRDEQFKYRTEFFYWIKTYHPTLVGLLIKDDIDPIATVGQNSYTNFTYDYLSRWGNYLRWNPIRNKEIKLWVEKEMFTGLKTFLTFRHVKYNVIPNTISYEYNTSSITNSEFEIGIQYAKNTRAIRTRGNSIIYLGPQTTPIITLRGIFGFKDILGSNYSHQKIFLDISQREKEILGIGSAVVNFYGGYIFNKLPYPLLKSHRGNNSIFVFENSSEGMNSFEFVSDFFAELHFTHYFKGFLINKIPLLHYLNKWTDTRLVISSSIVWGGLRKENQILEDADGEPLFYNFNTNIPYVDVSFGFENIFKIFRMDFVRRLTYLSNRDVSIWRIKLTTGLQLF